MMLYKLKLIGFIVNQFSLLGLHQSGAEMMHCHERACKAEAHRQLITEALGELLFRKD